MDETGALRAKRARYDGGGGKTRKAYRGRFIDSPTFGEMRGLDEARLVVVENGEIVASVAGRECDQMCERLGAEGVHIEAFDESSHYISPGFIDLHVHAPQFSFMGAGIDKPLMTGFLPKYAIPAERETQDTNIAHSRYSAFIDTLIRNGTTTALIFASVYVEASKVLANLCVRKGFRAYIGKVSMDQNSDPSYIEGAEALENAEQFVQFCLDLNHPLVHPVVTPRFIPSCSPPLLRGLGGLAKQYDLHITSHMSESVDEVEFVQSLYPGRTDAEILGEQGLLRPRSVMAHCVHMTSEEVDTMVTSGASIAHCPLSNFYFAGGCLPAKKLVRRGVCIGLGTDVAGGYSPSMLNAMRNAVIAGKVLTFPHPAGDPRCEADSIDYREAFHMATRGGALALGLNAGTFDVGNRFDAVLFNMHAQPQILNESDSVEDKFVKTLNNGDDRHIARVWIDGAAVHE